METAALIGQRRVQVIRQQSFRFKDLLPGPVPELISPVVGRVKTVIEVVGIASARLGQEQQVRLDPLERAAPLRPEVRPSLRYTPGNVHAKTVNVKLSYPVGKGLDHPALDFEVVVIQIRQMKPVEVMRVSTCVIPVVVIPVRRCSSMLQGVFEIGVFFRRMIRHEVHQDPDSPGVSLLYHPVEVLLRAVFRVQLKITGDRVTVIARRRCVHRREPDGVNAQVQQVIQFLGYTLKTVAAKVARDHAVNDGILYPGRILRLPVRDSRLVVG